MNPGASSPVEKILVVDDNAQNRRVAEGHLVAAGYAVTLAEGGAQALSSFEQDPPNLVLLDVLMPEIDGFETCRRIRALRGGAEVPIVFLTALNDLGTHQQALESGADDFLTKPINRTELLMRVRSLLWIKRLRHELSQGYDLIRSQRDALLAAQRQTQECTEFVIHDLKNPLASILLNAELLANLPELAEEPREMSQDILGAATSMHRMVMNLLDISRSEDGVLEPRWVDLDLGALIGELQEQSQRRAAERQHRIDVQIQPDQMTIVGDRDLLRRLFENLIDNAFKYSPAGGVVRIDGGPAGEGWVDVRVRDHGPGIPAEYHERVFDKYVRLEHEATPAIRTSRGLGLAFCRLTAELHGGRIWVESDGSTGSVFAVRLPVTHPSRHG